MVEFLPDIATGLGGVVIALLGWVSAKLNRLSKAMKQVDRQVSNDHSTNLRDDVTKIGETVTLNQHEIERLNVTVIDGLKRLDRQHGETHRVLTQETTDRQAFQERSAIEHHRLWERLNKLTDQQ